MKKVIVLMSTYNGEKYLQEQIESILKQEKVDVHLVIRDDGSTDGTIEILKKYEESIDFYKGENLGYIKSYLTLLYKAPDADYYAFADQDDVWEPDKLYNAITKMDDDKNIPILYASALNYVDENLNYIKKQEFNNLKLDFYSEFVRHRFAGCTYVFNKKLKSLCSKTEKITSINYSHDGYLCLITWFCGGKVIYDSESYIKFRRHGNNVSVGGKNLYCRIKNELCYFGKKKGYKSDIVKFILHHYESDGKDEYKIFFERISKYRDNLHNKVKLATDSLLDCGIKQYNFLFKIFILLGCI